MPNSVAKRRSRFAILVAFAVVASVFTAALPASAATGDVEFPATYSACVAGATADAGFSDTTGNFADASIDCLKYYGITIGTSATTYSPGASVTRWQMALFLIRAAGPAGITVPAATSQGFTDIASLPQSTQDAINQLAALTISKGTSTTTYAPNDVVSRYQMALFLIRFLEVQNGTATLPTGVDASGLTDTGNVSNEAFLAIEKAWDHGITKGTSATLFSPFAAVTRDQMAAFIARTLAHTNARPAGVSLQVVPGTAFAGDTLDVQVSVRDAAFKPSANALVDVFEASLANKATAVKTDGTCDVAKTLASFGGTECAIDAADPDTDSSGNFTTTVTPAASTVWWAWTGTIGATFDKDTTQVATAEATVSAAATTWEITDNSAANASEMKYGSSITWTFQLTDGTDPVALAGKKFTVSVARLVDGVVAGTTVTTLTSDATGKATISQTETDPNTGTWVLASATDNENTVTATTISSDGLLVVDSAAFYGAAFLFNDDPTVATTTVAGASTTTWTTGTTLGAKATVYDQYGIGKSGVSVTFSGAGIAAPTVRVTNSSGVASQLVTKVGTTSELDVITANAGAGILTDTVDLVFAQTGTADPSVAASAVFAYDLASNTIVLGPLTAADAGALLGGYVVLTYKDADAFTVSGTPGLVADFEEGLDVTGLLTLAANYNPAGTSSWTLS